MNFLDTFIYSENRVIRILRHVLFWTTDIVSYLVVISSNTEINAVIVYGILSRIPLVAAVVYFVLYYLMPRYSSAKNRGGLLFWILGILVFVGVGIRFYKYYIIGPIIDPLTEIPADIWSPGRILGEIFSWMAIVSLAFVIKLIKTRNELQQKNEQLLAEKRTAELSFLKAQMHPHFLFNTLNTLYSDAIKTNSKSEQIVLRLSSLMRFMLEECNKLVIPIEKEIKVIDDYIELEKLRHGDRLKVDWKSNVVERGIVVSPLLFLPFVENSFKHTLSTQTGTIPIHITLDAGKDHVKLVVENDCAVPTRMNGSAPGMGIRNARKQLELLFGKNFELEIKSNEKFTVNLTVPVSVA